MSKKDESAILRAEALPGKSGERLILDAAKHNLREISGHHIDPERGDLNRVLRGPQTAAGVFDFWRQRTAGHAFKRKDNVRCAEILFGLPCTTEVDTGAYFAACTAWVEERFGDVVLSAVAHYDESHPHLHVLLLPARHGEWLGSEVFGDKADIRQLRKAFVAAVGLRFGVREAPSKLSADDRRAASDAVLQHLRETEDPVLKSSLWHLVADQIRHDPRPWCERLGIEIRRKLRTVAQVMTSKGRGPRVEPTPIGVRRAQPAGAIGTN